MPVYFNGRSVVHRQSQGVVNTTSINLTGMRRQPIAYQNVAKSADAVGTAHRVFVNGNPLCHQRSMFAKSQGDEAGDRGGIYSGTVNGPAYFLTASPNVFIEGIPAVRAKDLMTSNHGNTNSAPLEQRSSDTEEFTQPPHQGDSLNNGNYYLLIEINDNRDILESIAFISK